MQSKQEMHLDLCVYVNRDPNQLKISFPMKYLTKKLHEKLIEFTNNFILRVSGSTDPHPTATAAAAEAISKASKSLGTPIPFTGKSC